MNEATKRFIETHRLEDVPRLALQKAPGDAVDMSFALNQIQGWQIAKKKIPSWANTDGILYPPHLSLEQCSSEQTALYKQRLCHRLLLHPLLRQRKPFSLVDLTGGLGVDFSFMSREFDRSCYVERQKELCELAENNFPLLGLDNAKVMCQEAETFLSETSPVTFCFLDPARRDTHGGRTYAITDCTPDVIRLKDVLLKSADYVLLKLSPMLDWHQVVQQLGDVLEVHIVSVGNECKEILVVMSEKFHQPLQLFCVDDEDVFLPLSDKSADLQNKAISSDNIDTWSFLYEPNSSIMNAGCFDAITRQFPVVQISANSHLFVSEKKVDAFPGRQFRIIDIATMNKRSLKLFLRDLKQANITVRNFPMSVAELRKRLRLGEGGDIYLFATTTADRQHILLKTKKQMKNK